MAGHAARPSASDDYAHGRRDGLRLALAILAAEEAKWAALLGESPSWRTNMSRDVRHKALQVAQTRIQTALNRLERFSSGLNREGFTRPWFSDSRSLLAREVGMNGSSLVA